MTDGTVGGRGIGPVLAFAAFLLAFTVCPQGARAEGSAYDDAVAWMSAQKSASGFLPGATGMTDKMAELGARLTAQETSELWSAWTSGQRPSVSGEAIAELVRAKRTAIDTMRLRFSAREESGSAGHMQLVKQEEQSFLSKHGDLKVSVRGAGGVSAVRAYDGQRVRMLVPGSSGRPPHGIVEELRSRAQYFAPTNPMALQMLLDSRADMGSRMVAYDLSEFLASPEACVLEKPDTVDGRKAVVCILGTPPTFVVWLDPERNYAVLRFQTNRIMTGADGAFAGTNLRDLREATDFVDCGNGIWLPKKVVLESRDGAALTRTVVTVDEMAVNQPVDDSEFVDVFPAGTLVEDHIARLSYAVGDVGDVGSTLSEAVESLKQMPLQSEARGPEAGPDSGRDPGQTGPKTTSRWLYGGAGIALAAALLALLVVFKRRTSVAP